MTKVFAIYPIDKSSSTAFLNRINTFEARKLGRVWHCYKVYFEDEDHERCIKQSDESHFVLFMGHGRSDCLHGACATYGDELVDGRAKQGEYYDKKDFINTSNIANFKGKVLFCFSCNSNRNKPKDLARLSIEYGVESFVGFGDLPTDYIEGEKWSKRCIAIYKGKIVRIIKYALYYAVNNNETVDNLVNIIRILTCKEIQKLLHGRKFHGRNSVIELLYRFENDIIIFGNRYSCI